MLKEFNVIEWDKDARVPHIASAIINTEYIVSAIQKGYNEYMKKTTTEVTLLEGKVLLMIGCPEDLLEDET